MGYKRKITDSLSQAASGFFIGIFSLFTLVVGSQWYNSYGEEIAGLPIIEEFTDTYKEGVKALGGLANASLEKFYSDQFSNTKDVDVNQHGLKGGKNQNWSSNERLVIQSSWDGDAIIKKLKREKFSKSRIKLDNHL